MIDFKKWYEDKGGKSIITTLRYKKEILNELIRQTNFLPSTATNSERVYCAIHNIKRHNIKCPYCNIQKKFMKLNRGYHGTCGSKECVHKHRCTVNKQSVKKVNKEQSKHRRELTCMKKYGVKHNWCNDTNSRKLYQQTMVKKYGNKSPLANKEILDKKQTTMILRWGSTNMFHHTKTLKTMLDRFPDAISNDGKINIMTSEKGHKIWEDSVMKHYGVKNPMQVLEVFNKQQKAAFQLKEHKNGLFYRGTYELDFLNIFSELIEISNDVPTVDYGEHKYFPDFYIPSKNLIIEIKSSYYYKRDRDIIIMKALAVLKSGYEFMIIIDKDYSYFKKYLGI